MIGSDGSGSGGSAERGRTPTSSDGCFPNTSLGSGLLTLDFFLAPDLLVQFSEVLVLVLL